MLTMMTGKVCILRQVNIHLNGTFAQLLSTSLVNALLGDAS